MPSIPKLSTPLAKGLRTSEGVLIAVLNLLVSLAAGIDPHSLSRKDAAIVLAATNGVYALQRTVLKITAVQSNVGIAAPIENPELTKIAGDTLQVVRTLEQKHAQIANGLDQLNVKFITDQLDDILDKLDPPTSVTSAGASTEPAADTPVSTDPVDPAFAAAAQVTPDQEQAEQPPADAVTKPESARTPDAPSVPASVDQPAPVGQVTTSSPAPSTTFVGGSAAQTAIPQPVAPPVDPNTGVPAVTS